MTHILEGKTIIEVFRSESKEYLYFKCVEGDFYAYAEGDCCSYSWVENVENNLLGYPCKVLKVEDQDLHDKDEWTDEDGWGGELLQFYGLKITTDRGALYLDYRNLSNGYYGGSLAFKDDWGYYKPDSKVSWVKV